jgi:hypothetical protein
LWSLFSKKEVHYHGTDGLICKAVLEARQPGIISNDKLGIALVVKEKGADLVNEIKRIGYMKDRDDVPIELRVGDTLIVYIST